MKNIVFKFFLLFSVLVFYINEIEAIKVKNSYIYRQPDGSLISLISEGDEFFHYTTTIRGDVVAQKRDGFYYYATLDRGGILLSDIRVTNSPFAGNFRVSDNLALNELSSVSAMNVNRLPDVVSHRMVETRGNFPGNTPMRYNVLIIPVQFSDVKFTISSPAYYFQRMANEKNFGDNGATGSLKDYFDDNLIGFDFNFTVSNVITLDRERTYYGANSYLGRDINIGELVSEACTKASQGGVNFSNFDNDRDGEVDQVCFIYAGHNEAEGGGENTIWPVMDRLYHKAFKVNGVLVDSYVCVSELRGANTTSDVTGIGVFCHEFSHALGLPDFYDLNGYTDGLSISLQETNSLMDHGWQNNRGNTPPYMNAIEREYLGVANVIEVYAGQSVELEPIDQNSSVIKVVSRDNRDDFFLLECRKKSGWDSFIDGEGLAIYHVDRSYRSVGGMSARDRWEINLVNTFSAHQCAYMVSPFLPGKEGIEEFTSGTTPAFVDWSGNSFGVALKDISFDGNVVRFNVVKDLYNRIPSIKSHKLYVYQDDVSIEWVTDVLFDALWRVEWNREELFEREKRVDYASYNHYKLKGLDPDTRYKAHIYFSSSEIVTDTLKLDFRTQMITNSYPRIDGVDNTHPKYEEIRLKVLNLSEEVLQIKWRINGKILFDDKYVPEVSGEITITAEIIYLKDRSTEIITKKVVII